MAPVLKTNPKKIQHFLTHLILEKNVCKIMKKSKKKELSPAQS